MRLFAHLRATRAFRKQHLGFLETREDHDIVQEVGFHQERGMPLTVKQLQLLGLASMPTLQRRLRRLRQIGALVAKRSDRDKRAVELRLSPRLMRTYVRYGELIETIRLNGSDHPAATETGAGA